MSISFFKRMRSRTSESSTDSARRVSREDEMFNSENNPVYISLLSYGTTRTIKTSSIPRDNWTHDDERMWLFKTLVEVCDRSEYSAYDIVTRWENRLYELDKEGWQILLGSQRDGGTVYGILHGMVKRASRYGPDGDDLSMYMSGIETWVSKIRFKWWS